MEIIVTIKENQLLSVKEIVQLVFGSSIHVVSNDLILYLMSSFCISLL